MTIPRRSGEQPGISRVHLSVIIPTLTQAETAELLARRILRLLPALTVEVIVVTPVVVERPGPTENIRYVADGGRGIYQAYSRGLGSASGEYVWFIGDDDYPLDAAACIGGILLENAVDMLIAPVLFSSGRIYRPTRTVLFLHFLNWCQQGVIYRRSHLLQHRFFRRLKVRADQYVNIRMRSNPAVKKKFLSDPICMFGVNGVSGRLYDSGYHSLRLALARRTLGCCALLAFRALVVLEPAIKRIMNIRS